MRARTILLALILPAALCLSPTGALAAPFDTTVVSRANGFGPPHGDDEASVGSLSPDGRLVVFNSYANNLVGGDANKEHTSTSNGSDVFLRDVETGTTTLVSRASDSTASGNNSSVGGRLSANERFVVFYSAATNLIPGDVNGQYDVFVRDLQTDTTTLVSSPSGEPIAATANGFSSNPSISADGRYVAFASDASNLVGGDTNGQTDIFVRDLQTDTTTLVSRPSGSALLIGQANGSSFRPSISADGRYVAFESWAKNLILEGDTTSQGDVFLRDLQTDTTTLVSRSSEGTAANAWSFGPSLTPDGRHVAFSSAGNNLVAVDANGVVDVFLRNLETGQTRIVSRSSGPGGPDGNQASRSLLNNWVSADGRFLVFESDASNLVADDSNGKMDIFIRDMERNTTRVVSRSSGLGAPDANGDSWPSPAISADGRVAAFSSAATNLVASDTNRKDDVFLRERPDLEELECRDGADNDGDGKFDYPADPGCSGADDESESEPECQDGKDNDSDGAVDHPADPGCESASDTSESPDPKQCQDGADNDSDGKADFPADPGCESGDDTREGPDPEPPAERSGRLYQAGALGNPGREGGYFAGRGVAAGDLNGDRVRDLFVRGEANSLFDSCGAAVFALSGKDRSLLYRIDPPCPEGLDVMSVLGDVDGDGVSDLVAGSGAGGKQAYVFSGQEGKLLHRLVSPSAQGLLEGIDNDRFGDRVGRAGDVTDDGVPDVLVGAPGTDTSAGEGRGRAYIFDGATGALVRTLDLPDGEVVTAGAAGFGNAVQGPGDLDGDGTADQLVAASGGEGAMYLFSGQDGELLRTIRSPAPQEGSLFGFQEAAPNAPGDVDGDGTPDLYAGAFDKDGAAGSGEGRAWVFDGKSCASREGGCEVLYELEDPTPTEGGAFGWSIDRADYDGDGSLDLYVGQAPHHVNAGDGGSYVFDGKDGGLLKALELPSEDRTGNARLGWWVGAPGDLNGDGQADFAAGAPGIDKLYVFLSGEDPTPPEVSISDVSAKEGDTGETNASFKLSLSRASSKPVSVDYATADDTAKAPGDYTEASGTVGFSAGEQQKTVTIKVQGDVIDEPDERLLIKLSDPKGATMADAEAVGTITDDDPPPALSVSDVSVAEGKKGQTTSATFTVSLSAKSAKQVAVAFATASDTATAPEDYTAKSGTLSFVPGEQTKTVTVQVVGDNKKEPDERFYLRLSSPSDATIGDGEGIGTLKNDDAK